MILLTSVGPNDSFEWGDLSFSELKEYQYQTIQWDIQQSASYTSKLLMGSTLMTTLNVNETHQNSSDISTKHQQKKMKMKKKTKMKKKNNMKKKKNMMMKKKKKLRNNHHNNKNNIKNDKKKKKSVSQAVSQ